MRTTRKKLLFLVVSGLALLVHALFFISPAGERFEYLLLESWFEFRGAKSAPKDVVIISMDEESYRNLGVPLNQGWPRALHVELLRKLAEAKAKRVVFDILFLDPGADPEADAKLTEAFKLLPTVIGADEGQRETPQGVLRETLLPYTPFAESVSEVALVGQPIESGVIRHFRRNTAFDERLKTLRPLAFAGAGNLKRLPKDRDLINFYGPAGTITQYSYYQVLEQEVPFPLERLKDKIVFVGLQLRSGIGPQEKDSFLTSFNDAGAHFGLEIHATATANLLSRKWIRRYSTGVELAVLSLLLLLQCGVCFLFSPLRAVFSMASIAGIWFIGSYLAFAERYFLPGLFAFAVITPIVYLGSTLSAYLLTWLNERQLKRAFALYLSPHVAKQLAKDPKSLALGGDSVVATALFTDIVDFTPMSEKMTPQQVTQMLNDYFSEVVDIIFEQEGTLIKFIGDAVFALWGAPLRIEKHADAALRAAVLIRERTVKSKLLRAYPPIHTRLGLHTGPMVIGNLGSRRRFDFTAIGDSVNLASRVEGLNKYLGTEILLTDAVRTNLTNQNDLLYMGKVRVVGKTEAVGLYTVLKENLNDSSLWLEAIDEFQKRAWSRAEQLFKECKQKYPELSKSAEFYLLQLEGHVQSTPDPVWSGELVLKTK